jgi:hypothetical protein
MNLDLLSADIARRVPAMAKDSPTNNAELIKGIIREHMGDGQTGLSGLEWATQECKRRTAAALAKANENLAERAICGHSVDGIDANIWKHK